MSTRLASVALACAFALAFIAAPARAQQSVTFRDLDLPWLTIQAVAGAEFVACPQRTPSIFACALFDEHSEEEIKLAFATQLAQQGWIRAEPPVGAVDSLIRFFQRGAAQCPPRATIMIFRGEGRGYDLASVPDGKIFYLITYAPDFVRCPTEAAQ